MGQSQSNHKLYCKLFHVIPSANKHCGDDLQSGGWWDKPQKPFASDKDRDQFIYSTITVLSQNGTIYLGEHTFRLLYSRRDNERIVARIVAENEGIVKAQIEPDKDGKNQYEAFMALRRHVEIQLDRILSDVPGAAVNPQRYVDDDNKKQIDRPSERNTRSPPTAATTRSPPASPITPSSRPIILEMRSSSHQNAVPLDAPPAYGKAVRDWRAEEKKS